MIWSIPYSAYKFKRPVEPPTEEEYTAVRECDRVEYFRHFEDRKKSLLKLWKSQQKKKRKIIMFIFVAFVILFLIFALIEEYNLLPYLYPNPHKGPGVIAPAIGAFGFLISMLLAISYSQSASSYRGYLKEELRYYGKLKEYADASQNYSEFVTRYQCETPAGWLKKKLRMHGDR